MKLILCGLNSIFMDIVFFFFNRCYIVEKDLIVPLLFRLPWYFLVYSCVYLGENDLHAYFEHAAFRDDTNF